MGSIVRGEDMSPESTYATSTDPSRVLSIQSTVVYGYVGNKASVFPLQLLGFDVDPIHSCELSNHTGYKSWAGRKSTGEELKCLIDALLDSSMVSEYKYCLTGYMSNVDFIATFQQELPRIRAACPNLLYLCDPVMGDNGKLYCPAEFVPIYRSLIASAVIVTPNQTEAELLCDTTIDSEQSAFAACEQLHQMGPRIVVLTSCSFGDKDDLTIVASDREDLKEVLLMTVPRREGYWSGTGDLTSALLVAHFSTTNNLAVALERTVTSVQAVMVRTAAARSSELCLIQSAEELRSPDHCAVQFKVKTKARKP